MTTIEDYGCQRGTCPSELELERRFLDELAPIERAAVDRAVASCEGCSARFGEFSAGFGAFGEVDASRMEARILTALGGAALPPALAQAADAIDPPETPAQTVRPGLWDRLTALLRHPGLQLGLGVAAAALIFFVARPPASPDTPGVRMKGSLSLVVHRDRAGAATQMMSGEPVGEGDQLRFEVTTGGAGHLMILGREASGAAYLVYPMSAGGRSAPHSAGRHALPGSVVLDASQGRERLFAIFCPEPFERGRVTLTGREAIVDQGCTVATFDLHKGK